MKDNFESEVLRMLTAIANGETVQMSTTIKDAYGEEVLKLLTAIANGEAAPAPGPYDIRDAYGEQILTQLRAVAARGVGGGAPANTIILPGTSYDDIQLIRLTGGSVTRVELPNATTIGGDEGALWIQIPTLEEIYWPEIESLPTGMSIYNSLALTEIVSTSLTNLSGLSIKVCDVLTRLSFPNTAPDWIELDQCPNLTELDFPLTVLTYASILATGITFLDLSATDLSGGSLTLNVQSNSALTSIDVSGNWVFQEGGEIFFQLNALNEATVNAILAKCVAQGMAAGTLRLNGGTNAAPTGQGLTDVTTLTNAGMTVYVNS